MTLNLGSSDCARNNVCSLVAWRRVTGTKGPGSCRGVATHRLLKVEMSRNAMRPEIGVSIVGAAQRAECADEATRRSKE